MQTAAKNCRNFARLRPGHGEIQIKSELKLPYGEAPDGRMLRAHQVARGRKCCCKCPECKAPLEARWPENGVKPQRHFAHVENRNCKNALETMLHKLAKQFIADAGYVWLPKLFAKHEPSCTAWSVDLARRFDNLSSVALEPWEAGLMDARRGRRYDIVARSCDRTVIIEIEVTHKCDKEKVGHIEERGHEAIEINLSKFRDLTASDEDRERMRKAVLFGPPEGAERTWLYNPKAEAATRTKVGEGLMEWASWLSRSSPA